MLSATGATASLLFKAAPCRRPGNHLPLEDQYLYMSACA